MYFKIFSLLDSTYEQGQVESLALNFKLREGDILDSKISTRNVIKDLDTLWPNKTIPYQISEDFGKMHMRLMWILNIFP